jgi:light-harvesting complex I chlorophyll a/b binding protein 3
VKSERPKESLTFPTLASKSTLTYLDGSLPGDFGFDPLGLTDPTNSGGFVNPQWLQYSEIIHARWAMLGAAGCIAPEVLAKFQPGFPEATNVVWFASGVIPPAGGYKEYWTDSVSLFYVEAVLMNFAELKRLQDFRNPGSQGKQYFLGLEKVLGGSGNPAYPGGQWFNLLNLGKTEAEMNKLKLNEIMNGRLAMLAMFGYGAQAVITRQGPFQNLLDHLEDPVGNNLLTNFGKVFGA